MQTVEYTGTGSALPPGLYNVSMYNPHYRQATDFEGWNVTEADDLGNIAGHIILVRGHPYMVIRHSIRPKSTDAERSVNMHGPSLAQMQTAKTDGCIAFLRCAWPSGAPHR